MESRVELFARIRRDARVEGLSIRELARRHGVGPAQNLPVPKPPLLLKLCRYVCARTRSRGLRMDGDPRSSWKKFKVPV